jgi:hypothetical protein
MASTYKPRNRDFEQRLATRRDTLVLAELELLHACILILEPQEPVRSEAIVYDEVTGSELFRFEHDGREPEYDADLECE